MHHTLKIFSYLSISNIFYITKNGVAGVFSENAVLEFINSRRLQFYKKRIEKLISKYKYIVATGE